MRLVLKAEGSELSWARSCWNSGRNWGSSGRKGPDSGRKGGVFSPQISQIRPDSIGLRSAERLRSRRTRAARTNK